MTFFADTSYWLALVDPRDPLHARALELSREVSSGTIVTSQMILVELLASVAANRLLRGVGVALCDRLETHRRVRIVPQSRELFIAALELYRAREDKAWSLTDCSSFRIMRRMRISDALTYDHHFRQAGFNALLRSD